MSSRKTRKYVIDKENKIFIKSYSLEDANRGDNLRKEYEKGIKISKIINYPKPIKLEEKSIYYELLDIECSLFDLLVSSRKFSYSCFEKIGRFLRTMHDNDLIHGDFSPINVVFTKSKEIFFIDASFSRHNTKGLVLVNVDNIYHDISLFFVHLKISKPLYKPWKFFQFMKYRKAKELFLKGYFDKSLTFNEKINLDQEIKFMENYIYFHRLEKMDLRRLIHVIILKTHIFINKLSVKK